MMMDIPYTVDELVQAAKDTVRVNGSAVLLHPADRVLRLRRDGAQHAAVHGRRVDRVLAVGRVPRRRRGHEGRAHEDLVVDAPRPQHDAAARRRRTGNYVNSSLAKVEALKAGYDEAIMLNPDGLVSECTGENIFVGAQRRADHAADRRPARSRASRRTRS